MVGSTDVVNKQRILIAVSTVTRVFFERVIREVALLIGIEAFDRYFRDIFPEKELRILPDRNIAWNIECDWQLMGRLLTLIAGVLTRDFGYQFSERLLQRVYDTIKEEFPGDSGLDEILQLVPENSLEQEKIRHMSRSSVEGRLLERTKQLEALNANLEQRIKDRTNELAAANANLAERNVRLETLSNAKTEFISFVAHQLQAPITAIRWELAEAKDMPKFEALPTAYHAMMVFIASVVDQMLLLVRNLLDVARVEEGRMEYRFERIDFKAILEQVVALLKPKAAAKNISVSCNFGESVTARGDKESLVLVFENLLDNAIKYTPEGKSVSMSLAALAGARRARLVIRDEGIGIPKAEQARIFERYFRASNAKRTDAGGTGIGLYIVRQILQAHGATIAFESAPGQGTAFTIEVPMAE